MPHTKLYHMLFGVVLAGCLLFLGCAVLVSLGCIAEYFVHQLVKVFS